MQKGVQKYFAGLLVIAFALWILGTSSSYQTCKAAQTGSTATLPNESLPPIFPAVIDSLAVCTRCVAHVIYGYRGAITALATLLIALFTLILKDATDRLWKSAEMQRVDSLRSIEATEVAAEAAMLSARSAIALQLPIIRIKPHALGRGQSSDGQSISEYCSVEFLTFYNLGLTKAFPVEVRYGWAIGETLVGQRTFLTTETFPPNLIYEPDPTSEQRMFLQFNMPLKPGEWSLICETRLPLWFSCTFGYDDFMGKRHDVAFCWRWQQVGKGMDWRVDETIHGLTSYPPQQSNSAERRFES
jgi:hypothetical protein